MKPGRASQTAVLVCMGRAVAHGSGGFSDPTALVLLPDEARARVERFRAGDKPRGLRGRMMHGYLARQSLNMLARTVAIDEAIVAAAAPQLVILGAGLDGRAWRLPALAEATVFEVDHPDTQRDKRARIAALAPAARDIRFVAVDFTRDDLGRALEQAGHDPARPTTWLWEGVVMYLGARHRRRDGAGGGTGHPDLVPPAAGGSVRSRPMSDIDRRVLLQGAAAAGLVALAPGAVRAAGNAPRVAPAAVQRAIQDQLPATVERIQRWIRQPSVSSTGFGIEDCCKLTMELLREAGFQTVKRMPTARHPGIFATFDAGARRTLGLYFMYDVQPVEEKEWSSPPWKAAVVTLPEVGKVIMGRGAVNQKGPQGAFLSALHAIRAAHEKLPVNLVLVAEGEEEQGSPHFHQVVRRPEVVRALRRSVGVVMPGAEQNLNGSVEVGLGAKGILYVEIEASAARWGRGPKSRDIHSSLAAVVDSPVWRLVEALQTLRSKDGNEPAIDGLAEKVRPPTDSEKKLYDALARSEDEAEMKKSMSVDRWVNDLGERAMLERLGARPSINIDGIHAGYTGEGSKTILPSRAVAKVDIRLVPDLTADDVMNKLRKHLDRRGYSDLEIRRLGGYDPNQTRLDARLVQAQLQLYRARKLDVTIRPRRAGSWPGYLFTTAPVRIAAGHYGMGYGDRAHSKDEFYVVEPPAGARFSGLAGAVSSFADYLYALASA